MGGSNLANQPGIYGTGGKASSSNVPGARYPAVGWTDASGNLWLFGGWGYDIDGNQGFLNDLWKYSGGQWTWVNGSNLVNANGTYGTKGTVPRATLPELASELSGGPMRPEISASLAGLAWAHLDFWQ